MKKKAKRGKTRQEGRIDEAEAGETWTTTSNVVRRR